ncbi:hypothetical protein VRK_33180 [Vibrio sp. MEBiC08052]|nr:hypothetical protein VRK_33180 [Vibrio sp. MEBiC08052]
MNLKHSRLTGEQQVTDMSGFDADGVSDMGLFRRTYVRWAYIR